MGQTLWNINLCSILQSSLLTVCSLKIYKQSRGVSVEANIIVKTNYIHVAR